MKLKIKNNKRDILGKKGFYLLPNIFTTASLFAGFYAIVQAMNGLFDHSAIAIFIALILDGLDGRVARLTNTESDFGAEYDSLSDMVSFGIAPAIVIYGWGLTGIGKVGIAAAFVYASCAALRLARFNVQSGISSNKFFIGLPSPAAAALIAGFVWSAQSLESSIWLSIFTALLTACAGLLMVSNFKYPSFKSIDLRGKVPFVVILSIVMSFVVITIDPPRILLMLALGFALYAPVKFLWARFQN